MRDFQVAYFAASCDTPDINRDFAKSLKLDYPILSDPEKTVASAYGVVHEGRSLPERWTFFIGTDGNTYWGEEPPAGATEAVIIGEGASGSGAR